MLGKYNHVYFVLFFLVLFYLGLTADYTNIVASCVALPIWTRERKITGGVDEDINNMNVYNTYDELIQSKVMLCVVNYFPFGFKCLQACSDSYSSSNFEPPASWN